MHFYYDTQGRPAMVDFNGTKYMYLHNLQGDIVGLLDTSGQLVVEYRYDAWGKLLATSTLTSVYTTLANLIRLDIEIAYMTRKRDFTI